MITNRTRAQWLTGLYAANPEQARQLQSELDVANAELERLRSQVSGLKRAWALIREREVLRPRAELADSQRTAEDHMEAWLRG